MKELPNMKLNIYFSALLLLLSLLWSPGLSELKFDLDGNLLDDGLSRALAHSPEGFDLVIEEKSTATTTMSATTIGSTTSNPHTLLELFSNQMSIKDILMEEPESEQVRSGAKVAVSPGEGKKIISQNIHREIGPKKQQTVAAPDNISDLEDYQYLTYPQDNSSDNSSSSTESPRSIKKFLKQVVQMNENKEEDDDNDGQTTQNVIASSTPLSTIIGIATQNFVTKSPTTASTMEEDLSTETSNVSGGAKDKKHSIDSLIPCSDVDELACKKFKPFCNIEIEAGFLRCQKTCGFCRGKSIVYEAQISNGINGVVEFQQFFPKQPVYMTGCFENSEIKGSFSPYAFVIHKRRQIPNDENPKCPFAGPHWNPYGALHGDPTSYGYYHQGDLGNIVINKTTVKLPPAWPPSGSVCSKGQASTYKVFPHLDFFFNPPQGLILSIHKEHDDLGHNLFDEESRMRGRVGKSLGCGIIRYKVPTDTEKETAIKEVGNSEGLLDKAENAPPGLPTFDKKQPPSLAKSKTRVNISESADIEMVESSTPKLDLEVNPKDDNSQEEEGATLDTTTTTTATADNESLPLGDEPVSAGVREFPIGRFGINTLNNSTQEANNLKNVGPEEKILRSPLGKFIAERSNKESIDESETDQMLAKDDVMSSSGKKETDSGETQGLNKASRKFSSRKGLIQSEESTLGDGNDNITRVPQARNSKSIVEDNPREIPRHRRVESVKSEFNDEREVSARGLKQTKFSSVDKESGEQLNETEMIENEESSEQETARHRKTVKESVTDQGKGVEKVNEPEDDSDGAQKMALSDKHSSLIKRVDEAKKAVDDNPNQLADEGQFTMAKDGFKGRKAALIEQGETNKSTGTKRILSSREFPEESAANINKSSRIRRKKLQSFRSRSQGGSGE